MQQIPQSQPELRDRIFDALCADILDPKSRKFQRVDALRGLVSQGVGDAFQARSGGLRPEPKVSALHAPATIAKGEK